MTPIEERIDADLAELARGVIRGYLDPSLPETRSFLAQPDAREQHQTRWHQWGILTHTRMFLRHFNDDIPRYLREWDLWSPVDTFLTRAIDGAPRWRLLRIAILLHDIGKFGARTRGGGRFHFSDHESLSGAIIRGDLDLTAYGLTQEQTEYIARTAEDHFVLGRIRRRARERGSYSNAFTSSPEFTGLAKEVKQSHPDDFVEIGVLFLGDSLAKANPQSGPPDAVSQYQINIDVAHRYLEIVLNRPV